MIPKLEDYDNDSARAKPRLPGGDIKIYLMTEKQTDPKRIFSANQAPGRRSAIKAGTAMLGACLITSSFTSAKESRGGGSGDPSALFNVKQYGATGNRADNATGAFRDAVQACAKAGGGTVFVPPGEYTVGSIQLLDNVSLQVDAGATLFMSQSRDDFQRGSRAMIFAENAKNISVTGMGTLDGLAQYDYLEMTGTDPEIKKEIDIAREAGEDMKRYYRKRTAMNCYMFYLNDCANVKITGVSVVHSPLWNLRLNDCDRVHISGIYIFSDLEKGVNADGIDLCSCSNVTISDAVIVTGDDAIVLKSISRGGKPANPCENVTVTNCVLESSSTPLVIGTETEADIRHVVFNNCVIRNSNRGLGINVQDGATVSSIIFSNITIETNRRHWNWWGSAELLKFTLSKRKPDSKLGKIRDVFVSNIIARVRGTSTITGHPDQPLENIRIMDVQLFMNPEDAKDKRASDALRLENVNGLKIRDLTVNWAEDETEKKWASALVLKNVSGFEISSFSGRQGLKDKQDPVIRLDNASSGIVRDSQAAGGSHVLIHLQGKMSRDIILRNNLVEKSAREITYENQDLRKVVDRK